MKGGGNMQHPEYLYHYTTLDFVPKILEDGFLMLTPSNLVKPKRYWKERREDLHALARRLSLLGL